ncbi:MAG TPA: UvrD-helicase domain-containing protein, partial [Vicinamibacterales bacterium]
MTSNLKLPFDEIPSPPKPPDPDEVARAFAVDPRRNVVLEASAGTGKTRVLVERYVNLLRAGVDPGNILAITFTRKAAAEMRQRILARLKESATQSVADGARWRDLRERAGEIAISTIDAFCLSLLREFPLEADLEPGFAMADETETPRYVQQALDNTLRICRGIAREQEPIALVFAQIPESRIRVGLEALLNRRLV